TEDGSRRIDGWVDAAALATGRGFADALTASEIAGAASAPIVLVRGDGGALDPAMKATLNELGATSAMIAGGRGSVSACVEVSLISAGIGVTRYGGANRYDTSQLINAAM
uniref:cell wall-binding repeat-containing protein n=1 Tax=Microbacterium sp. TaxID=51671 RepID=UPI0025D4678D